MTKAEIINIEPDYIHSANTVFNFMKESEYLEKALSTKSLPPRYCEENIECLNLQNEGEKIKTVSVLQKCFCDIPLRSITEKFPLSIISDTGLLDNKKLKKLEQGSTHTDFYGNYGIAFSKSWAHEQNLQPVQYINPKSDFTLQFKDVFECILAKNDIDDLIVSDIILRLAYFKPLFGKMSRSVEGKDIIFLKNFYDECEWRFVPKEDVLEKYNVSSLIFDEETKKYANKISDRLAEEKYKDLWLNFEFQDIRYLIVPDNSARIKLIDFIIGLDMGITDANQEKYLLISKILVLSDIKRDF